MLSPSARGDLAHVGAQVQLDVAAPLQALLQCLPDDGRRGGTGDRLREGVHLGGQRFVGGKRRGVDEALDIGEREQVETRDPLREGIDELDELRVGDGAVDVPVPLGEFPVEVLATERISKARPRPTMPGSRVEGPPPGTAANPTSNCPSTARSRLAKRMSVARANSLPAPRALPRRAVIVTGRDLASRMRKSAQWWKGVGAAGNAAKAD
jgi:hypothetical protein